MRGWRCLLLIGAFAVGACDKAPERTERTAFPEVPEEFAELHSNAFSCAQDTQRVPVEHSEHCVVVAEQLGQTFREECWESTSYECLEHNLWLSILGDMYSSAVVESLIRFYETLIAQKDGELDHSAIHKLLWT